MKEKINSIKKHINNIKKQLLDKFFIFKDKLTSKLKKLNMLILNFIYNFNKSLEKIWETYKYLISLSFLFILFVLLAYFFNEVKSILIFKNTSTWISAIASTLAVITALYLNKKQPKLKLGTEAMILSNNDVFISFLNRTKSDGFVKIVDINVIAYKNLKKYKKGKYSIINDDWIKSYLKNSYPFDLKVWHSVSSRDVTNVYLNKSDFGDNPENVNTKFFLNELLKLIKDTNSIHLWDEYGEYFTFYDLKLEVGWITNDRSEFAKKVTYVSFKELEEAGVVKNPFKEVNTNE